MTNQYLRRLAGEATPGPWTTEKPGKDANGFSQGMIIAAVGRGQGIYANPPGGSFPEADRRFIAAANPATIIALCDQLDAQAAEIAILRSATKGGAPGPSAGEGPVFFYERDFYVLSNFSAFRLRWRGHDFDTSEHAYHWRKFAFASDEGELVCGLINHATSAHEAFKIAEQHKHLRQANWDDVKIPIMREILWEKVQQHEYVRRKLLATRDRELIEDSWRDDFWGWGPNRDGKNMLGKLWMEVRADLRRARADLHGGNG